MQDLVDLQRQQMIDLRDARVDHHLGVARDGDGAFEHLGDESLHEVLAALARLGVAADLALLDDLVEEPEFLACS